MLNEIFISNDEDDEDDEDIGIGSFCITQNEYYDNPKCTYLSPNIEGKCLRCSIEGVAPENCNNFKNCQTVENSICVQCENEYILDENFNCTIKYNEQFHKNCQTAYNATHCSHCKANSLLYITSIENDNGLGGVGKC